MKSILVVEDNVEFVSSLSRALRPRFQLVHALTVTDACELTDDAIAAVLLDLFLSGEDESKPAGLDYLRWMRAENRELPVIVVTAHGDIDLVVEAMRLGADDFIDKGQLNVKELERRVLNSIQRRTHLADLQSRLAAYEPGALIGSSDEMKRLRRVIRTVAHDAEFPVVLSGEVGTGKELVARMIHAQGPRSDGPFIGVNAATSKVHSPGENGAYRRTLQGSYEQAFGGVLFIDEVSLLAIQKQRELAALLKSNQVSGAPYLLVSTTRNLENEVMRGLLLPDLVAHLGYVSMRVPPLREHGEDIPELVEYFLARRQTNEGRAPWKLAAETLEMLKTYSWPGNVRELRAVIESASVRAMSQGDQEILPGHLSLTVDGGEPMTQTMLRSLNVDSALARRELECVSRALEQARGVKNEALRLLGYGSRQAMLRRVVAIRKRFPEIWTEFPDLDSYYGMSEHD